MRTLTAYAIAIVIVLGLLNALAWLSGTPRLHDLNVFSAGFALGVLGTFLAARLYGYRRERRGGAGTGGAPARLLTKELD